MKNYYLQRGDREDEKEAALSESWKLLQFNKCWLPSVLPVGVLLPFFACPTCCCLIRARASSMEVEHVIVSSQSADVHLVQLNRLKM